MNWPAAPLALVIALSLSLPARASAFPVANAIVDQDCRLAPAQRLKRVHFLEQEIARADQQLRTARESLATFNETLSAMNKAYLASRISQVVAATAGVISGVGALYEVFYAEGAVTAFGITSRKIVETYTVSRLTGQTVSLATAVGYLISSKEVAAGDLGAREAKMVEAIRGQPFVSDGAVAFLSAPDCSGYRCPTYQKQIEDAWDALHLWHEEQSRAMAASDGTWYNPFSWEWKSHHFSREIAEVEIPWVLNTIDLLKMRKGYLLFLREILVRDGQVCAPMR